MTTVHGFPPGYCFVPTDLELIEHYLRKKINNESLPCDVVQEINVYASGPDDIADKYKPRRGEKMYFFTSRERKGKRPSRKAGDGYWKAQTKDILIYDENNVHVGSRKMLKYMINSESGKGEKSKWIMHEYTIVMPSSPDRVNENEQRDLALCKIYETPRYLKSNGTKQSTGDSRSNVINNNNDASQDIGDSQLNVIRRISSEPSLVESIDDARSSKIRRVSSDESLSSYPSQHLASSSMTPGVLISAASTGGINSVACQDNGLQYVKSSTFDQEMQMPAGPQQELSFLQVPDNGDGDWDNLLDFDEGEVDWDNLLNFDDNVQFDSGLQYDQSLIPLGMQTFSYQQEQFNQIPSNSEADRIGSLNFGGNNLLNGGLQYNQSSMPQEMQMTGYQQQQFYQMQGYNEAGRISSLNMTTTCLTASQE